MAGSADSALGILGVDLNADDVSALHDQGIEVETQDGRAIYATTFNATTGVATSKLPQSVIANGGLARFSTAIDIENQSKDQAWSLTTSLRKRYSNNWEGAIAYTHARARDVQSFGSSTHISNWQFGRTLSGDQLSPFLSCKKGDGDARCSRQNHAIFGSSAAFSIAGNSWESNAELPTGSGMSSSGRCRYGRGGALPES